MLNQEYSLPEVPKENFARFSITELENQEKIEKYSEMEFFITVFWYCQVGSMNGIG